MYIIAFPAVGSLIQICSFVYNTSVFHANTSHRVVVELPESFAELNKWCTQNKQALYAKRCEVLMFGKIYNFNIIFIGNKIEAVNSCRYL